MNKDTIQAASIQRWLDTCPKVPLRDEPLFRLVWSDDERELRLGTYCDFDNSGNKIREYTKLERVLKYNWLKEVWVLEQWFPPHAVACDELPESRNGSYEPIYVFENTHGKKLPLALEPIQFIVKECLKPKTSEMAKRSLLQANKEIQEKRSFEQDLDVLNDEGPLVSQFADGSAILLPGKDF